MRFERSLAFHACVSEQPPHMETTTVRGLGSATKRPVEFLCNGVHKSFKASEFCQYRLSDSRALRDDVNGILSELSAFLVRLR
jgi:hypothetical protein